MRQRRESAQRAAEERGARKTTEPPPWMEAIPWLRKLGFRADQARRAAEGCVLSGNASLEERLRAALACMNSERARGHHQDSPVASAFT